jgi:hypothetical protein
MRELCRKSSTQLPSSTELCMVGDDDQNFETVEAGGAADEVRAMEVILSSLHLVTDTENMASGTRALHQAVMQEGTLMGFWNFFVSTFFRILVVQLPFCSGQVSLLAVLILHLKS